MAIWQHPTLHPSPAQEEIWGLWPGRLFHFIETDHEPASTQTDIAHSRNPTQSPCKIDASELAISSPASFSTTFTRCFNTWPCGPWGTWGKSVLSQLYRTYSISHSLQQAVQPCQSLQLAKLWELQNSRKSKLRFIFLFFRHFKAWFFQEEQNIHFEICSIDF